MSSSVSTTTNGVVVITHVHPAGNATGTGTLSPPHWGGQVGAPSPPHCGGQVGQVVSSVMGKFREGHPIVLGTVQIMVGAMSFLIGIATISSGISMAIVSGIFVWGAVIYIIAGSLTIAADKNLNKCLVKASMGMNVVAAVAAGTGFILYSLDTAGLLSNNCDDYYPYNSCENQTTFQGVSGVMVVFSLLEFMISICASSFACKAVCHSTPEVFIIGNHLPQGSPVAPQTPFSPPNHETVSYPKGPEGFAAPPNDFPPQYSPATIP